MNLILSVNSGSSSLKFKMYEMPEERVVVSGQIEKIGLKNSIFTMKYNGEKDEVIQDVKDHSEAVALLLNELIEKGIITNINDIKGVGHRVVHGGERFSESVIIDDEVIEAITELSQLAPLHNPVNLIGIIAFMEFVPHAVHVATFDTAFHQTMDAGNYLYPLPYEYYEKYKIRRYGFHGTSHYYVSRRIAEVLNKDVKDLNLISVHLGNGASITAIKGGHSINTSMGFTPLAGIMMGTRSGDVDPAILPYLMNVEQLTSQEVLDIFNHKSGMYGVSQISSDARDIVSAYESGNPQAALTLDLYANRVSETIGSYFVKLGRVDAILFTGGIGENSNVIRQFILERIYEAMGIDYNLDLNNEAQGSEMRITTDTSKVDVWVIPTDEEIILARDTFKEI